MANYTHENPKFKKFNTKAQKLLSSPAKLREFFHRVGERIDALSQQENELGHLILEVKTLIRMVVAYRSRAYRKIPFKSVLMIMAGLVYLVTPFDFVPDFIPGIGYIDDITVLYGIIKSLQSDIEAFRIWEFQKAQQN